VAKKEAAAQRSGAAKRQVYKKIYQINRMITRSAMLFSELTLSKY